MIKREEVIVVVITIGQISRISTAQLPDWTACPCGKGVTGLPGWGGRAENGPIHPGVLCLACLSLFWAKI